MDTTHANAELFAALSKAQAEITNAPQTATNAHFKSKYAPLNAVLDGIRKHFSKHGLCITQETSFDGDLVSVTTLIAHSSGGFVTTCASCRPANATAQSIGSCTTYLRRYSASSVSATFQEELDDDGEYEEAEYKKQMEAFENHEKKKQKKGVAAETKPIIWNPNPDSIPNYVNKLVTKELTWEELVQRIAPKIISPELEKKMKEMVLEAA